MLKSIQKFIWGLKLTFWNGWVWPKDARTILTVAIYGRHIWLSCQGYNA
jgi:hypothetical protein